jgi:hypothetical protein
MKKLREQNSDVLNVKRCVTYTRRLVIMAF